jgi:sugar phosphate isomerase/epimerase
VGSVHLKDTDGGFHSPNFPRIGTGVVDFPGVFEILGRQKFTGPYTLELEGPIVSALDVPGRVGFLRDCMAYLRSIKAIA